MLLLLLRKFHLTLALGLVYPQVSHKPGVFIVFLNPLKVSYKISAHEESNARAIHM